MGFIDPSSLLLIVLICSFVGDSLATPKSSVGYLNLLPLNDSLVYNATRASDHGDILTVPTLLPYGFFVPNSQMYLRLGFGFPRRHLEPSHMVGLIAVVQHAIAEGIARDGENTRPSVDIIRSVQNLGWTLGDGFDFDVWSVQGTGVFFNWGHLRDVVEGLRLYLIVGQRFYATAFDFWDGPGWRWRTELGGGGIE